MQSRSGELKALGAGVVVVTFEPAERIAGYREAHDIGVPVVSDPARAVYARFGMLRGSRWKVWSPRVLWRYLRLVLRGRKLEKSESDVYQLGGDVVLDAAGVPTLVHRSQDPVDRPEVDTLLEAIRAARPDDQRPQSGTGSAAK